jgi:uncharacterized membrane protein
MPPAPDDRDQPQNNEHDEEPQMRWSFRDYRMHTEEFSASLADFYRGEIQRANIWRTRLDSTTNWAVLTTIAAIILTFSNTQNNFVVVFLCSLLLTFYLWIEARRYRYYELWSYRVRLMETDFFAAMLVPPFSPSPEWAESLAESLLQPSFSISNWEAIGRRFRRNYAWLFFILAVTWLLKLFLHPLPAGSWEVFVERATLGPIPGWAILAAGLVYNGLIFFIGLATVGLRQSSGEVLPKFGDINNLSGLNTETIKGESDRSSSLLPHMKHRRQQLLSFIITSKPEKISQRVMEEMKRGATGLHGQGMYTSSEREVVMIAVMVTEIARLKLIVQEVDPNAFFIVTQAQEVFGRGFHKLTTQ